MTKQMELMRTYQKITPESLQKIVDRHNEIVDIGRKIKVEEGSRIFLVANGSSGEGVRVATYLYERILGIKPYAVNPYQFNHYPSKLSRKDIVLALSQTGTSKEVVDALRLAKKEGAQTIGVTTIANTPITEVADFVVLLPEGFEDVDYKVVGVVVNMLAVMLVGYGIGESMGLKTTLTTDMQKMENSIARYNENADTVKKWVESNFALINSARSFTVVGSGPLKEAADELAIKITEITNKLACSFELEEYLHGGCAVTDEDHLLLMVVGKENKDYALNGFNASTKYGKKVVWLGPDSPVGQPKIALSEDWIYAIFDAMAAVHAFVITFGELGNYGAIGTELFAFYQKELKVRESKKA